MPGGEREIIKGHEWIWGGAYVQCYDCDDGFMGLYEYQNLPNGTL